MKTIQILLNVPLASRAQGEIVTLATDSNGRVTNPYWAARIRDSKIDKCVSIVTKDDALPPKKTGKKS